MQNTLIFSTKGMIDFNVTSIQQLIREYSDEQKCVEFLEKARWGDKVVSPFDPSSKVYKLKNNRYKCKNTGKVFSSRTGTIFAESNIKLNVWFVAIFLFTTHKGGISSMELHREIGVTQKTAWFMCQRMRQVIVFENDKTLYNIVEVDETFVGGKNKNRHGWKKVKDSQGRSCKDKTPVFGMVERQKGRVSAHVVKSTSKEDLLPHIQRNIDITACVMSDEWMAYRDLDNIYDHLFVNHGEKQYVNGDAHTNNIENFWSQFKRGVIGVYRKLSNYHLQRYVDEFVFRRNTCKFVTADRFVYLLEHVEGSRLRYKDLIKGRKINTEN